ncbi:MAG: membrane dipeptidase [Isosphaeraceae bacterium]
MLSERSGSGRVIPTLGKPLGSLITRIEAEFPGRLLIGPVDHARWRSDLESEGLCWECLGSRDSTIRSEKPGTSIDSTALRRGVRVYQMAYSPTNQLAGSSTPGDDRGLLDLGRDFLSTLLDLAPAPAHEGPRPILDLAHLNPTAMSDVLTWFEADSDRASRVPLVYSHGGIAQEDSAPARLLQIEPLRRLRALGGVVGLTPAPPFHHSSEEFRAGLERVATFPGPSGPGFGGVAIGSDILGVEQLLPDLPNVEALIGWLGRTFDPLDAGRIVHDSARRLIEQAIGCDPSHPVAV